jgi:hypothetical protein
MIRALYTYVSKDVRNKKVWETLQEVVTENEYKTWL